MDNCNIGRKWGILILFHLWLNAEELDDSAVKPDYCQIIFKLLLSVYSVILITGEFTSDVIQYDTHL